MQSKYLVRTCLFQSGERLPVLLERKTGLPLQDPLIFILSELRVRSRATSTIAQANRAIIVLYLLLDELEIDLDKRLSDGRLLTLGEIDLLIQNCYSYLQKLQSKRYSERSELSVGHGDTRSLPTLDDQIQAESAATRCIYIRDYLKWFVRNRLLKLHAANPLTQSLSAALDTVIEAINARTPFCGSAHTLQKREGVAPETLEQLRSVIDPHSPLNPWFGAHVRLRNYLMIELLHILGPRRGELLNIKISDIDFQVGQLYVARRADDPADPRLEQPLVKTRARKLPLGSVLLCLLRRYILEVRGKYKESKKHEFLFVANGTGRPISLVGFNKVFLRLRRRCLFLPRDFSPHTLRHTWNEEFSRTMDEAKVSEAKEQQMRSYLMGWSPTSTSAATYTKRHIKQKAIAVSLEMQLKLGSSKGGG